MSNKHETQEIISYLKNKNVSIIATKSNNSEYIRLRVMYYGVDNDFSCYLMSVKDDPKIDQIINSNILSLLVYSLEEPYDKSWEIEINGEAKLLKTPKEIEYALEKLKDRNPFADVALEAGITSQFALIKLTPKLLRFRIYGEALKGASPTILEF